MCDMPKQKQPGTVQKGTAKQSKINSGKNHYKINDC